MLSRTCNFSGVSTLKAFKISSIDVLSVVLWLSLWRVCNTLWRVCRSGTSVALSGNLLPSLANLLRAGRRCGVYVVLSGKTATLADLSRFLTSLSHTLANLSPSLAHLSHSLGNLLCSDSLCGEPVALSGNSAALADLSRYPVALGQSPWLVCHLLCCQRVFDYELRGSVQQRRS